MKKLQDNLAARIAASVILTVSFLLTLLSTAGIVLLASYQAYNDGGAQLRTSYLHAAGVQEYYDHVEPVLEGLVHEPQSYQNYLNSLNVHVDVKTTDGTTVFSNAKEGETSLLEDPFSYTFTTGETKLWKNTFSDAEKAQRALERFPYQIEDYEIEASPFEYSTSYSPIDESLGDALDETLSGVESYYPMLKIWYYPEGSLTEVAYFSVRRDKKRPFTVKVGQNVEVKVLGTQFNLQAYPDAQTIETTLCEGSVNVSDGKQKVTLTPSQQAVYSKVTMNITTRKVDVRLYSAWKEGLFVFENKPLEEIMTTLSRWYNVNVFYANQALKTYHFTGDLERYGDFRKTLSMIEKATSIRFKINGNNITVEEILTK